MESLVRGARDRGTAEKVIEEITRLDLMYCKDLNQLSVHPLAPRLARESQNCE